MLDNKFYHHFQHTFDVYFQHHRPLMVERLVKCPKEERDELFVKINYLDSIKKEIDLAIKKDKEEEIE